MLEIEEEPLTNCTAAPFGDDLFDWRALIVGPTSTPYEGGVFKLKMEFTNAFPFAPPKVQFMTPIYHPNVDKEGHICVDILRQMWSPALTISASNSNYEYFYITQTD